MAPELIEFNELSEKNDVFSIGLIYYFMLFGKLPWSQRDKKSYLTNVHNIPLQFPADRPIS